MTIQTKYSLTDTVWIMEHNRPIDRIIGCIDAQIGPQTEGALVINYGYFDGKKYILFNECAAFSTKEELLKSL